MGKQDPTNNLHKTAFSQQQSVLTLKVLIHCEGCKRKVKRIIKCVDGVESVNIDPDNGKVTVVGSGVDTRELLNSLDKAGKHAEIWQFGGGKQLPIMAQAATTTALKKDNQHSNNPEKSKTASQANNKNSTGHGKGKGSHATSPNTDEINAGFGWGKPAKGGGQMMEVASAINPSSMVPPSKPPFPNGGGFSHGHGGSFENPILATNNVAILSKSVAPRPPVYRGESSFSPPDHSAYASAEYATYMFSDENANNCSVM